MYGNDLSNRNIDHVTSAQRNVILIFDSGGYILSWQHFTNDFGEIFWKKFIFKNNGFLRIENTVTNKFYENVLWTSRIKVYLTIAY